MDRHIRAAFTGAKLAERAAFLFGGFGGLRRCLRGDILHLSFASAFSTFLLVRTGMVDFLSLHGFCWPICYCEERSGALPLRSNNARCATNSALRARGTCRICSALCPCVTTGFPAVGRTGVFDARCRALVVGVGVASAVKNDFVLRLGLFENVLTSLTSENLVFDVRGR